MGGMQVVEVWAVAGEVTVAGSQYLEVMAKGHVRNLFEP